MDYAARPPVTRVGHVGFSVPDLDAWSAFVTEAGGLREIERADGGRFYGCGGRHHSVRLEEGPDYGCTGIGLDIASDRMLDELVEQAGDHGLALVDDGPAVGITRRVRMQAPDDIVLELCAGPDAVDDGPYDTFGPRPRKLGHVTLLSAEAEAVQKILLELLGFRVSDLVPGNLTWMRCNADHHGLAVGSGPSGVHHCGFEISGFDRFELLGDNLERRGYELVWGPGRHGPGHNLYAYFVDPGGGMFEMYADMQQIEDDSKHVAREWTPEAAGNRWGPQTIPPQRWIEARTPFIAAASD